MSYLVLFYSCVFGPLTYFVLYEFEKWHHFYLFVVNKVCLIFQSFVFIIKSFRFLVSHLILLVSQDGSEF